MKQYNKTYLPDEITFNGESYKANGRISTAVMLNNTSLKTVQNTLKMEGRKMIVVNVMSKSLKGKSDLYGHPYKPNKHIFTT